MAKDNKRRWLPLIVGGKQNGKIKRGTDHTSGAYAIRRKDSRSVVYVGMSEVGRMWRTLLRHFQVDNFRTALPRFLRQTDYEVTWQVTSRGARTKADPDPRARELEAEWIARWGKMGEPLKNIRGVDDDASFDFGANVEPEGAFDSVLNPGKKPRALVPPGKVKLLASGDLDSKESSALMLSLMAMADRGADREARETGDREAANARNHAARGEVRAAFLASDSARAVRRDREMAALRASSARPPEPGSYEHELAVMRARSKVGNPGPAPSGPLVELGILTRLRVGTIDLAWSLRDAPCLAYDKAGRLFIVYGARVVGAAPAASVKEYRRTHWGRSGKGDLLGGGLAPPAFVDLGPATSITYTTRKGIDLKLVDYVHPFGEGSSRRCVFPRVVEHKCPGGCAARCAARGALALVGGSYTVEGRGIVG